MGTTNFDIVQASAFIGGSTFLTQGQTYFVKPRTGSDGANGKSPRRAFKTLEKALAAATANQNDVVYLFAESNDTSADTTDYQTTTLDWNKDLVHLIGINAGGPLSQRSRVAFISTYDTASNLFTLSADSCLIANISFFAGVAGTAPLGSVKVTGSRNVIRNCHIAGIGNDANDIAGAYSLKLDGASENLLDDCTIGLDTIARGTGANSGVLVDTAAARNEFRNCRFIAFLEHATNHVHVRLADATAIDRYLLFKGCLFYYFSANYAAAGTGVMKLTADLTQGWIIVDQCTAFSDAPGTAIKWDVDDRNKIQLMQGPTPAADTAGVSRPV
jgi:hypothetical protein